MVKHAVWVGLGLMVVACGDSGSSSASATSGNTGLVTTATATETATMGPPTTSGASETAGTSATEGSASESASATDTSPTGTGSVTGSTSGTGAPSTGPDPSASSTGPVSASSTTMDLPPGVCGDGVVNPGEACDDGDQNGPEGNCYPDCTQNVCGDGVVAPLEECDLGAMNGPDSGCSVECVILPSSCGQQSAEAEIVPLPVDIIIVIDNSGSMSTEIKGVQDNINKNFAAILENSGLDYRVILVAAYGKYTSQRVCIEAPLSGIAMGGCVNPPAQPINNPGKFYHYSLTTDSHNSWCKLLSSVKGADKDQFNLAPMGWQQWLRDNSFKIFIELSDDRPSCTYAGKNYNDGNTVNGGVTAANAFDAALRATLPLQFGMTPETRNYNWYSIIGMPYNNPPEQPYTPKDPVLIGKCPSGVNGAPGYQTLSNMTNALRFPLCDASKYDVVFNEIALGVLSDAKIACEFTIPPAPMGKTLDKDSVTVVFTPQDQMNPVMFGKVDGPAQCDAMSFYLEGDKVILCPEACVTVQGDKDGSVEVEFTCEALKPN